MEVVVRGREGWKNGMYKRIVVKGEMEECTS